jgi:hypothetical protein
MNWMSVAVSAGCGALGGVVASVLTLGMGNKSRANMVRVAIVVLAGIAGSQLVSPKVVPWLSDALARTPYEKFERATANGLQDDPDFKAYVRSLEQRGLTSAQASQESRALGARGMRRLSDADLLRRAEILAKGLDAVDVATCARVGRGTATGEDFRALLDSIGEPDALALAAIATTALRAEVRQSPSARSESTEEDARRILQTVASRASPEELGAIAKAFDASSTPEDACSGVRALYRHLPAVPSLDQPRLALMLAGM